MPCHAYRCSCRFAAIALLLVVPALAQSFTTSRTAPPHEGFLESSIVVDVNEVNVFFNVHKSDRLVQGLTAGDFEVYENDRPQKIRFFSSDAQEPLSLAIMVDSSTSQAAVLQKEQEVGRKFLDEILVAGDEALVIGFDSLIEMQQDFTSDRQRLTAAMARSSLGTQSRTEVLESGPVPPYRSTALYDAISATANARMRDRKGHKAMVILTDGQDMGSATPIKKAIEAAVRSDTICYVLLVVDSRVLASTDYKGIEQMKALAKETGGRVIMAGGKLERLQKSFTQVALELRHHYTLAYSPDDKERHGEYRTIKLKSRHGYHVQARRGYYATPERAPEVQAMR